MFDAQRAVSWSRERLVPGEGVFYMNDYVGPSYMQWTDEMLEVATSIRRRLPLRLLRNGNPGGLLQRLRHPIRAIWLPRTLKRESAEVLMRQDPSESADSERILPALAAVFPNAELVLTDGVGYHLALNDILQNFDEHADRVLLDEILAIDGACARRGLTHYAVALAHA